MFGFKMIYKKYTQLTYNKVTVYTYNSYLYINNSVYCSNIYA